MNVTALSLARRFIGIRETAGAASTPMILAMLRLDERWPAGDEVPWCSAFANFICWLLGLPRSESLRARSWLGIGWPVSLEAAAPGFDVVVMRRDPEGPGPTVLEAPGHVGFFAGRSGNKILILGGNQGDAVSVKPFSAELLLGIRRLA